MQHRLEVCSLDFTTSPTYHTHNCSHPELLEMELDVLYDHIGSAPVVTGFPAFAKRLADKELPHGAEVIVGIHARLLKQRQPLTLTPASPVIPSSLSPAPATIELLPPTVKKVTPPTVFGSSSGFAKYQPEGSSVIGVSLVSAPQNPSAPINGKKLPASKAVRR